MGYRSEATTLKGFNLIVIDVDHGTTVEQAKELLKDYTWLMYTTKRHTPDEHRFRMILPTSHVLKLESEEYKEFMENVFRWLPFEVDTQTGQRSRKWLTSDGDLYENKGQLLDVLPFIPKTSKNEIEKKFITTYEHLSNLQRWFLKKMIDGNRNNNLLKFAMMLVDSDMPMERIQDQVLELNNKLPEPLSEREVHSTIFVTVAKAKSNKP